MNDNIETNSTAVSENQFKAFFSFEESYTRFAPKVYQLVAFFVSDEKAAVNLTLSIAHEIRKNFQASKYHSFFELLCLRITFEYLANLAKDKNSTLPADWTPKLVPHQTSKPSFEQIFCLLLRDWLHFSCKEIAAIMGASVGNAEGSVRTKLVRTRAEIFGETTSEISDPKTMMEHYCIDKLELIENWNATSDGHEAPEKIYKLAEGCKQCTKALKLKIYSHQALSEWVFEEVPSSVYDLSKASVITKEGNRVLVNWSAAPWYVRALFEGLLATTLIVGVVLSIPKIKMFYEFWMEKRFDLYSIAEFATGGNQDSFKASNEPNPVVAPTDLNEVGKIAQNTEADNQKAKEDEKQAKLKRESEFFGRESYRPSSDKIYRVFIKSEAPENLQDSIMAILNKYDFEAGSDEIAVGASIPGGILYDVFVPLKQYRDLEKDLSTVGREGSFREIVTRSRERRRAGKAHVKIWLQRI